MKTFKLHLIRHGMTQGNLDGTFVGGGLDIPLCPQGIDELKELLGRCRYPQVGAVFSSPMKRALQTAELIYPHVPDKRIVEGLRENVFGEFEGRRADELWADENFVKWLDPQSGFVPKGGESGQAFGQRTAKALMEMMLYMATHNIPEAACVTHGGVIMSMLGQMAMPRKNPREWMTENGCGYTVAADAAMLMRDGLVEVVGVVPYGYMPG